MIASDKVPVTILTGFLGAGKTTLLNRILSENHGKRIAVIENEYGEIGIDHALVIDADEEIFEMSNGCICCTVRGDLIRVLGNLMKRRDKFDYVLVETTGLADPGPVAQTFFMDADIQDEFALDGIVTVVDAGHVQQQLGRSAEAAEQIAFADVLLLNKTDLLHRGALDELEARIRGMNKLAKVYRCQRGEVAIERVLGLSAFDLDVALSKRPTFLEPEYPFEWTGVYALERGRYDLLLDDGPDPQMSLVLLSDVQPDDAGLARAAEWCVRQYADPPVLVLPGETVPADTHARLDLGTEGTKRFAVDVGAATRVGLFAQHTAEEFGLRLVAHPGRGGRQHVEPRFDPSASPAEGVVVEPLAERSWVAQHEHDDSVRSFAIEVDGNVDGEALNQWLRELLRTRGADIFRMKGFIAIAGEAQRFVFQGVHMLFDGQPDRPWGDAPRRNQLVFIGRDLDGAAMRREFEACLI